MLLGIGVDNMFVMLASWRTTDPSTPTMQRMGVMYGNAATAVTLTSLTNIIAFAFGIWSPFRSIVYFSIYSAAAMLGIYVYQVFGFGSVILKMGLAESRGLSAYTFRPSTPESTGQVLFFHELFRSKTETADIESEYFPGTNYRCNGRRRRSSKNNRHCQHHLNKNLKLKYHELLKIIKKFKYRFLPSLVQTSGPISPSAGRESVHLTWSYQNYTLNTIEVSELELSSVIAR
ncbi:daf-6 [Cordylochernes scorpioides]|uniref:Daf-6 n=1 Tax=Cordylochernes scorpioides TaxID=51811 RepID=A0ABY6K6D2_9ARAC|nr:daf-6 [Cordylochernes scorpioides]